MSNYDWESDKGGYFTVGAEVINGTGQVTIRTPIPDGTQDCPPGRDFWETMTADEALDIGRVIINQAWQAKQAKWREDNTGHGPSKVSFAALRDARARMSRIRAAAEAQLDESLLSKAVLDILGEDDS